MRAIPSNMFGETHGVTFTPETRFMIYSAATVAFGWPTSFGLRNRGYGPNSGEKRIVTHTPKKKLSIEVANVDCIHINHMYVFES
jgi:hypothetical protein